jgi:hypothetical protein
MVEKRGNPDVLKLFHRHSVWMIRISISVKLNGIRHYSIIDLILPCFSHQHSLQEGVGPRFGEKPLKTTENLDLGPPICSLF